MSRYGVQVSQQGIDVSRAADYQKVLDSGWKFLDIYREIDVDVTIAVASSPVTYNIFELFRHGLPYVPAFEFIPSSKCRDLTGLDITLNNNYRYAHSFIRADARGIYCTYTYSGSPVNLHIAGKLRIYELDVMDEYQAPEIPVTSTAASPPSRYGAKFLDLDKGIGDIDDEMMYPFTLNTRGKQISIHKQGNEEANAGNSFTLTVAHGVGYRPSYMLCKVNKKSEWAFPTAYPYQGDVFVGGMVTNYYLASADGQVIEFTGVQSALFGTYAYIILKDPVEIAG